MAVFAKISRNRYVDSLDTLYMTSVLNEQEGVEIGYMGMVTEAFKKGLEKEGMLTSEVCGLKESDFAIVAKCPDGDTFEKAVVAVISELDGEQSSETEQTSFSSTDDAVKAHPEANMCSIAVPGEYALEEVTNALNAGLHCVVFSNNVPLEDERKMKELAVEKGLLCMGPDCGVANINGAALVLASINNRGPFGICGASGTGIQHVAAILHECGTGVSQTIGTGGNDLKEPVGGLMMQMGIDVLEADPDTKYIILISRKPADSVLKVLLQKIRSVTKPIVVFFMGCDKATIESNGGIFAANLDDCAQKALSLIGKTYDLETPQQIHEMALKATEGMGPRQRFVRGMYTGGTYMDEAMRTMQGIIGPIWSNAPNNPEYKLKDSLVCIENTCIDYGEEEFTDGRPHPAIDPSVRKAELVRIVSDDEVAVITLDFILTPPGHMDPAGDIIPEIRKAQEMAARQGRKIAFVATVLGTDSDIQNKSAQIAKLQENGIFVCKTNNSASLLAAEIIRIQEAKA